MKILIIALPRTGSTALGETLLKKHKLKKYLFEPFVPNSKEKYNQQDTNVVVKTLVYQIPKNVEEENRLEWLINLTKEFDETILLSRRDLKACGESWSYLSYFNETKKFMFKDSYVWEPTPYDDLAQKQVISFDKDLKYISEKTNVPITYYEDIYDVNSEERLRKGNKPTKPNLI